MKHIRIIVKEVYEKLDQARERMYLKLFEKYKQDPEYTMYESKTDSPNGMEFNYCKSIAWHKADAATLGMEATAIADRCYQDPDFKRKECGCCHNMTITYLPTQRPDGDWEITVEVG